MASGEEGKDAFYARQPARLSAHKPEGKWSQPHRFGAGQTGSSCRPCGCMAGCHRVNCPPSNGNTPSNQRQQKKAPLWCLEPALAPAAPPTQVSYFCTSNSPLDVLNILDIYCWSCRSFHALLAGMRASECVGAAVFLLHQPSRFRHGILVTATRVPSNHDTLPDVQANHVVEGLTPGKWFHERHEARSVSRV